MALVLKVNFQGTLRRWVVAENLGSSSFGLTYKDLESKIKELFNLPFSTLLVITYQDKDNDVVTLADDQDLIDACTIQLLNPLRLDVRVLDKSSEQQAGKLHHSPNASQRTLGDPIIPAFLRLIPVSTSDYKKILDSVPALEGCANSLLALEGYGNSFRNWNRYLVDKSDIPKETTLHRGIQCDDCKMFPIKGSRYKSIKENDYDLCEICFKRVDNKNDYMKIDYTAQSHGHHNGHCCRRGPSQSVAPAMRPMFSRGLYGWKPTHPSCTCNQSCGHIYAKDFNKLDARFVKDVTICDGTILAPSTKFTKIWRMSNIGILPWPPCTRLVYIGGDVLGTDKSVLLELPESGLPCGEQADIVVDLAAPKKPGRYVSYWCLSSPSGQKFGHRVWVVIHVVLQDEQSPQALASWQVGDESEVTLDIGCKIKAYDRKKTEFLDLDADNVDANDTFSCQMDDLVNSIASSPTGKVEQVSLCKSVVGVSDTSDSTGNSSYGMGSFQVQEVQEREKPRLEDQEMLVNKLMSDYSDNTCLSVLNSDNMKESSEKPTDGPKSKDQYAPVVDIVINNNENFGVHHSEPYSSDVQKTQEKAKVEIVGSSAVDEPNEDWFYVSHENVMEEEIFINDSKKDEHDMPHDSLLQELEMLGFCDHNANISALQKCDFDVEGAVNFLLVASGWDKALKDIEELGFTDKVTITRMLAKNKGSFTLAVKDLVKLETAAVQSQKL